MKTQLTVAVLLAFGASVAVADKHMEKKAPDAKDAKKAPDPKDAKKPDPKDAKKEAPKAFELPKPPQEIADFAKSMAGTWTCTGKMMADPAKPTEMVDMKAKNTFKLNTDLDKWWIQMNLEIPMGKAKMKIQAFTTFNPSDKKWYRYGVDNMGGAEWTSSAGPKDNKIVWEGESMGPMGKAKVRHHDDMSDAKAGVKVKGEMSMDGKTWVTGYEATCKK